MTVKDTTAMIAQMSPQLLDGTWVYCCEADPERAAALVPQAFATVREAEGITLILPSTIAAASGYEVSLKTRQITLNVFSDLEGIGLTAAVAHALTEVGISCNVVAAYHHDHVFVPEADADQAIAALTKLRNQAAAQPLERFGLNLNRGGFP